VKCLDGIEIERVETMKYLDIIIDDRLRFQDHYDYMLKKIGKKRSFLNRIGNYISVYTRCTIYRIIIAPHFEYCAVNRHGGDADNPTAEGTKQSYESNTSV